MRRWFALRTDRRRSGRVRQGGRRRVGDGRGRFLEPLEDRVLLAGDLISHWRADSLNDGVADGQKVSSWTDFVGGVAATASGSPTLVKGALSGRSVVRFDPADGMDAFKVLGAVSPMNGANDFTVSVVFATSSSELLGGTTSWYQNTGLVDANRLNYARGWGIVLNQSAQVGAGLGSEFGQPTRSVYSTQSGWNDGPFHLATLTRSGSTMSLYVDDQPAVTVTDADAGPRDMIDMRFGMLQTDKNPLTGDLAEVRIYSGMLDAAGVASLYSEVRAYYNNAAPLATDDSYTLSEDPPLGIFTVDAPSGVLGNDSDVEGDALSAVLVSGPAHGSVTLRADGSFVYAPAQDYFGPDTFTYRARDLLQNSNVATVALHVTSAYDPAIPVADHYKTLPTQVLNVPASAGVLANDLNPDRAALTAVLDSDVTQGSLVLNSDGSFQYSPQGISGTASFRYRIHDGTGLSTPVSVTIAVNTPPQAVNDTYSLDEDTLLLRTAANGVVANDTDAEGQPLLVTLIDAPQHGTLSLAADGAINYEPAADYVGPDQFTYRVSDGQDDSNGATVRLTVLAVDDAPTGGDDSYFVLLNEPLTTVAANGVLVNDQDIDSPSLTASLVSGPSRGQLNLRADGSFTYTPQNGFKGTDTFAYRARDASNHSAPVTVTLYVGAPPVQISEIMAANATTLQTRVRARVTDSFSGERLTPDWIELYNRTAAPLDLSGYHLTERQSDPLLWAFPENTIVPAGGYLVVYADRLNITNPALDETGRLHTNFKLDVSGEYLALTSPSGVVVDKYDPGYPTQRADVSYGIAGDGKAGYLLAATPAETNSAAYPGVVADTSFSVDRGFFSEAFQVTITTPTPGATIRYTLDGSTPDTTKGSTYSGPIIVSTTTVLKATAFKADLLPSNVDAQTYIFPSAVLQQSGAGLGGVRWGHNGPDWAMDPLIVNHTDPEVRPVTDDLKRIPTVSLALDFDRMWGTNGIYIRGENVETPVTFEYFDPSQPGYGVHTNSTVQIVGGTSPQRWKVDKLSMRVRFTEDQGASELDYPVFGADAATAFDTLVIDARMNNTWHYAGGSDPDGQRSRAQYLRDEFASDLQNELDGFGPHAQHVHVYINGIYWGMHILHERPDENFAASYLGGVPEDYDVIKHNATTVVSGSNQSYLQLNQILGTSGNLTDQQYAQAASLLDIDDFMDYMLINYYIGNSDWAHQNWYASRSHTDPAGKWRFHSWDAEHVMEDVNYNATSKNDARSPTSIQRRLITHPEYKLKFADRAQALFYHDGALTPQMAAKLYNARADEINLVMRTESARWGDNAIDLGRKIRYTRPHWVTNLNTLNSNSFPRRTDIVVNQLVGQKWFEKGVAPQFQINGAPQHGGFVNAGSTLTMQAPVGTIHFTTDGSDPRLEGGAVSPTAIVYAGPVTLSATTPVRARLIKADGSWSPVSDAIFSTSVAADGSNLRISEVHYHPGDPSAAEIAAGFDNSDDFEFIELVNISDKPIDLTQVELQRLAVGNSLEGVEFAFGDGSVRELAAGQRVVVVEDLAAFQLRYGNQVLVAGQWSGQLGNRSERVVLNAGDQTIHDFTYSDQWYPPTDGDGPSLQIEDEQGPLESWNVKAGWRVSYIGAGSPSETDLLPGDSNHDGVFDSNDFVVAFQAGEYEDDVPRNSTFEEGDWNGDGDFNSNDFVFAFQQGNYEIAARQARRVMQLTIDRELAAAVLADLLQVPVVRVAESAIEPSQSETPVQVPLSDLALSAWTEQELCDELAQDVARPDMTGRDAALDSGWLTPLSTDLELP